MIFYLVFNRFWIWVGKRGVVYWEEGFFLILVFCGLLKGESVVYSSCLAIIISLYVIFFVASFIVNGISDFFFFFRIFGYLGMFVILLEWYFLVGKKGFCVGRGLYVFCL